MIDMSTFLSMETRKCSWFAHWWMARRKQNPEHFPMRMEPGEWDEQFRAWEELGCPTPKGKTEEMKRLTGETPKG